MSSRAALDGDDGITLVELLVAMTVSLILVAVATGSVINALQVQRRQVQQVDTLNHAKIALERMTRELRAADPLVVAESGQVEVTIRRNGAVLTRSFVLEASAGGLQRIRSCEVAAAACTAGAGTVLLDGIEPAAGYTPFTYFGTDQVNALSGSIIEDDVLEVQVRLRLNLRESDAVIDVVDRVTVRNGGA